MARRRQTARGGSRRWLTLLFGLLILALPFALYVWGRSSATFTVDKVIVSGDERVSELEMQRILRADYIGHNLFTVTREDVGSSLSTIPFVADVTVNRDFPITLRVGVREYRPAAYVLNRGRWFAVAEDGYVVTQITKDRDGLSATGEAGGQSASGETTASPEPSASPEAATELPVEPTETGADEGAGIVSQSGSTESLAALEAGPQGATLKLPRLSAGGTVEPGKPLPDKDALLGVEVVAGLPPALRDDIAVVVVKRGEVTLYFAGGPEVVWGDGTRPLAKSIALDAVLGQYREKGIRCTFMNVSTPDRVLAKPMLK